MCFVAMIAMLGRKRKTTEHVCIPLWVGARRSFYASKWIRRLQLLNEKYNYKVEREEEAEYEEKKEDDKIEKVYPLWNSRRTGLLGYKIGCMSIWDVWGVKHAVTVVQIKNCYVLNQKNISKNGYEALEIGIGNMNVIKQSKNNIGNYIKRKLGFVHKIKEFKCTSDCFLPVQHKFSPRHFSPGQNLFISSSIKNKGFSGAMKKWGFSGKNQSHGTESKAHRSLGSVSMGKTVNIVFRNKKMNTHIGEKSLVKCSNNKLFRINSLKNLLFVKGPIGGYKNKVVKISDAKGRAFNKFKKKIYLYYPTFIYKKGKKYKNVIDMPHSVEDPFLYNEIPLYEPADK
ncbi:50S ribosomal protein L3 [Plasmodium ovale wallikeri]|uniref:Large ribosomal subunit protein uL3m n=2 Tax=Plasmodium ovale TaxID=36330 RepID=A0A1A9A277_PLAOA|nr:50S ribosomal protein L3 [Plasmodium ovale wallikeri]SBT50538.1 50S ribosomal protein L3 [Plasmodium ovale wallikeri]